MTDSNLSFNYNYLASLASNTEELVAFLENGVRMDDFRRSDDTKWCYDEVATYLEDGWTAFEGYVTNRLKTEVSFQMDTFGHLLNRVAGGYRASERKAALVGAPFLGEGYWPTRYEVAAYLCFICLEPPRVG